MNNPSPGKSFLEKIWSENTAMTISRSSSTMELLMFKDTFELGVKVGSSLELEGPV